MRECQCDPPGSGEEFCTGHCLLRARIAELEAVQQDWEGLFQTTMANLQSGLSDNTERLERLERGLAELTGE
jgi:hypothetical protein